MLNGPIFFKETVNSQWYLHMLRANFVQLMATQLLIHTQWFMQDSAMPHPANVMLDFLKTIFGPLVMSHHYLDHHNCRHFWPPLSPDLNPCDFFLWGFLKEKMFPMKLQNIMDMRAKIIQLCHRVIITVCVWLQEVVRQNGGHTEQVLIGGGGRHFPNSSKPTNINSVSYEQ
jgi:hypothetical protein